MSFWDGSQWVPDGAGQPPTAGRSAARHIAGAVAEATMITALVFGLVAGSVFAGQGGHSNTHGGTSAAVSVPDGVFGGTTTATVSSAGMLVYNACSQNGATVSQQWVQTDSAGHAVLQLGPTVLWTGGSATCTAQAGTWSSKGRWVVAASATFKVTG